MSTYDCPGCREYHELSRRQFLGATGGAIAFAASAPAWLPRVVYAEDDCSSRDVIVSIFLRGGCDGLTVCVPHGDPFYYTSRPTLAIPPPGSSDPNRATDLDGFFGLPPAMNPLLEAYNAGHLAIVHAAGSPDPSRSHFDAQRFMEVGKPDDPQLFTGWLGRHLMTTAPLQKSAILRAVGIGYALQRTLIGGPQSLPVPDLADFGLTGNPGTEAQRLQFLQQVYALVEDPVRAAALNTQATIDLLQQIDFAGYQPAGGAVYPDSAFAYALKSSAALIKAQVGVEAVAIDLGGWDTHNNQGSINGVMANLMNTLSTALAAFHLDVFNDTNNITLVIMSEFGRRVAGNGSGGSDHGHGNVMLVMGGYISGGRVLANWPGLAPGQLYQGLDLDVTIDYRDVLAEIVQTRLGNSQLDVVFPDYTPTFPGITRSC